MTQLAFEVRDSKGNKVGSLVSEDGATINVNGPLVGIHGISYPQRGNSLSKIGELQFTAPLHVARNDACATGNHIVVYEDGNEMGHFVIEPHSEQLAENGREAQFTCPDLLTELKRITVSSGFISDIGHINTGPQDPAPTRPPETLMTTLQRLLQLRFLSTQDIATAWGVGDTSTMPTNLDGIEFGVYGISVVEALGKLAADRFSYYKIGGNRSVSFGRFGQVSGFRLVGNIATPWAAQTNPELRMINTFQRDFDGNFVNDIVPRGAGNNSTQLTLRTLYTAQAASNPVSVGFYGFDPRFPIKRRPRWDFGGDDGYDYYIDTKNFNNSIARYGLSQAIYDVTSIAPTSASTADEIQAAATLYQAAIAHLQWYCQPHETFSITTEGRGDLRDLAGKTVRVVYREIDKDGNTLRDINKDYYVMEIVRTWDDKGIATDTWTLSSFGRYAEDGFSVFSGALQQLDYFRLTPTIFPTRESIYYDALVAPNFPASVFLDQDLSVFRMVEATFTVSCLPAVAPVTSTDQSSVAGAHFHNIIGTLPTNGATAATVDHFAPTGQYYHGHSAGYTQGAQGITANSGQFSHAHGSSVPAAGGGSVNNSGIVNSALESHSHYVPIFGDLANPDATQNLWFKGDSQVFAMAHGTSSHGPATGGPGGSSISTNHGHGSSVPATGGGSVSGTANGGFQPTTNGYAGFDPSVSPGLTSGTGGGFTPSVYSHGYIATQGNVAVNPYIATAYTTSTDGAHVHNMAYGYYQDPVGKASGITILVNGVRVDPQFNGTGYAVGPYNGTFIVDLAAIGAIPVQGSVQVQFASATFGRLLIRGKIRRQETTVAAHS